ncbi:SMEK domain-containing protein [Citrobacter sp. Marseille-Q3906]|uniref:SMEK domain-containing protein n=1 Tax=Citrobacter sp. Marseille-Q3906 TaxID=2866574 RepID=UPI001CE4641E|nr:SMEK domain-containing protein [Citrobacter sp. Marseille-Q3906]
MITSGYLIGQIIDEFSTLGEQAKLRNRLGLSDLSVFSENFFRDILNIIEGLNLVNTNEDRANEPGIDLGDEKQKIAFQVTTTKTSGKVINTLKKITDEQRKKYNVFKVLIVGEKQNSYSSVTEALNNRNTSEIHASITFDLDQDIMDLTDLARKVIGLPLPTIQRLNRLIQDQLAQVKIELQVPDQDGNYETSGYALWEPLPIPTLGDGSSFAVWEIKQNNVSHELLEEEISSIRDDIVELSRRLHKLPRITREFFAMLHERAEYMSFRFKEYPSLFLDSVEKTYPNAKNELALLQAQNLLYINADPLLFDDHLPAEIGLQIGLHGDIFRLGFFNFVIENRLSFRQVLGELDFSAF